MNTDRIALQLYTVREHASRDMLGTLARIAEQGYRAVELAGFGGVPVADLRAALDDLGVRAVSAHVGPDDLQAHVGRVVADLQALGCGYAVMPWLAEERRQNAGQIHELAEMLNRTGKLCREAGIVLAYHNHDFEFAPLDGTTMFDVLVEETDPELVALELDVYWVRYAGVDPIAVLRRLSGRVPLVHIKDMAVDKDLTDAPVGEGIFEWPEVLQACEAAGAEWYIVEQDNPADPLVEVERSLHNLRKLMEDLR
ncbi:MAG TPA: sugar phosphate isomerase/epimerase [Chloroflexia bacterium]|nr:sugar phosphate isomerase/epimerase [Chloroflexia bacterium]